DSQPAATGEVTQALPPVVEPAAPVDLSESATQRRATLESRGQASPAEPAAAESAPADPAVSDEASGESRSGLLRRRRRPLEPTPNLTAAFEKVRAARRRPALEHSRQRATVARYTGRVLLALSCTLVLVGTGYMWNTKRGWDGSWNTTAAIDTNDPNIRNKGAQFGDETYLIVGTDSRAGKNAKIGGGDADTIEGARADTILLVNIPADRSRVVAVSWPRDLQVDRPECQQWDAETGEYGEDLYPAVGVKLNGVYAAGGPSCMVRTLTQMSGLNINHFIAMDFEGFEKVVNAIGGVNVCSTVPLYDYELGYILRRPGTKKLTGKRALNYVRARNISVEGNGDYGRIKRQQLFMSSLLRSTLSSDVLSNPSKLNRIVSTFIEYSTVDGVDTDSLIELANSMEGVDAGRVTFLTIPTSGTSMDGENNEIPRTEDIDAIFDAIIDDKPLPGEKKEQPAAKPSGTPGSAARTTKTATAGQTDATAQYPGNITVRVLNGSGEPGAATAVMNRLIAEGINVPGVADASKRREDTVVRYGSGEKDSAATIAKMFPGARIQEDRTVKAGVEVILGSQFQGVSTVASPPAPGSTVTVGQLPLANTNSDLPNDLSVTNAGDTTCS
ncbi:putative LytR family regulatory protein, partial [Gordonia hirsuta DSM 44140 = NBRC 16056]